MGSRDRKAAVTWDVEEKIAMGRSRAEEGRAVVGFVGGFESCSLAVMVILLMCTNCVMWLCRLAVMVILLMCTNCVMWLCRLAVMVILLMCTNYVMWLCRLAVMVILLMCTNYVIWLCRLAVMLILLMCTNYVMWLCIPTPAPPRLNPLQSVGSLHFYLQQEIILHALQSKSN
jgi:hypothetical protein